MVVVQDDEQPRLVTDDLRGQLLAELVGQPLDVETFLRIGIGLAVALGGLHRRGLIHKDVKPGNIVVNLCTGQVWLTGFGHCTPAPHTRQVPEPPELIAGTLEYTAPEQTGRINRSVDSREDLYSCGVTLYQVLTGELPFSASDAMEWVHCHIARQPVTPRPASALCEGIAAPDPRCTGN
jgi:serine/threonine protein kinase